MNDGEVGKNSFLYVLRELRVTRIEENIVIEVLELCKLILHVYMCLQSSLFYLLISSFKKNKQQNISSYAKLMDTSFIFNFY